MAIKVALDLDPALSAQLITATRLEQTKGRCATGVAALDRLLGGGWPRGALGELIGRRSSGRTALLYASLASAISAGETVALVDSGGALDPRWAAKTGLALPHLLWIRCAAGQALKATDVVTAAGGFGLVALDLGEGRPRIPTAAWNRLKHAAERQRTAVVVATPWQTVGAFAASAINLDARGARFATDGPPLFLALESLADCRRGRWVPPEQRAPPQQGEHEHHGEGEDQRCAWLAFSYRS